MCFTQFQVFSQSSVAHVYMATLVNIQVEALISPTLHGIVASPMVFLASCHLPLTQSMSKAFSFKPRLFVTALIWTKVIRA